MKAQQEAGLSSRDNLSGLSVRSWAMQDIASGEAENFTAMQLEEQSWTLRLDASTDEESIIYIHNLRPIHTFRLQSAVSRFRSEVHFQADQTSFVHQPIIAFGRTQLLAASAAKVFQRKYKRFRMS